jgi:hypothetical protein
MMIPKRSAEHRVPETARDFEAIYQARIPPPIVETGPLLVIRLAGKGVPMVKTTPVSQVLRRGKGEQAQQTRVAVAVTIYTQLPCKRSPEEVLVASLPALSRGSPSKDGPSLPVWWRGRGRTSARTRLSP